VLTCVARAVAASLLTAALALSGSCVPAPDDSTAPAVRQVAIALPSLDTPVGPIISSLTRTRLIRLDQAGHERPSIIERWEKSADQRRWRFTVRDGVRLHDASLAGAGEVAALLKRTVDAGDGQPGLWGVTKVEVVDPRTITVSLREPTSLLLEAMSLVQAMPAGPFQQLSPEAAMPELTAAAPPSGQPRSQVERVTLRPFDTPRAAVAALLREDVDVLVEVPSDARTLLASGNGVRTYPYVKPYVVTLALNHRHPALAQRAVRQALNIAVDRDDMIAQDADGFGVPAADLLWREHWAVPHTADAEAVRLDRPRARQLLEAAGFTERRQANGAVQPRLRLTCLVVDHPTMRRVAARLQRTFASIGVVLDLDVLSQDDLLARTGSGKFEAVLSPLVTGYGLGFPYLYFGDHGRPRIIDHGYKGAEAAVERVRRATSDDELARAASDLHRLLLDDPPAVYLYWQESSRAVGPRVRVPGDVDGDVLGSLSRWTVTGAVK
jgi:peptide/nickel transport system substrate-binding protein